ncbi:MAG: RNA methyltransferase [Lentisphaerae bacterium]|nr:RNA methyltransferase [Lentisphaerota bacterium]
MNDKQPDSYSFVYGINPAFEAVLSGKRKVYKAYLAAGSAGRLNKLKDLLRKANIGVVEADKGKLFNLCRTREHQGIVLQTSEYPLARFDEVQGRDKYLLLDNIEDPHNLGAVLRSAEFFGWQTILLPSKGTAKIYPSVVKTAAGATEHLDIVLDHSSNYYVRNLKEQGYTIAALDAAGSEPISSFSKRENDKLLLVLGGEDKPIGQFILNLADYIVSIKRSGRLNSLNASVAAGIALSSLYG